MANVFTRTNDATPKPNRNTFDLSFVNNMTLKAGVITPCFVKEVMPGDSAQIDATFGFNFQPMVFPVQTDMQANLHFFYVRNRALWKGWQDFITKQENVDGDSTPPYIMLTEENRDMFNTCEIGDYIGVPTIYYGTKNESRGFDFTQKALPSISRGFGIPLISSAFESGSDFYAFSFDDLSNVEDKEGFAGTLYRILLNATDKDIISYSTLYRINHNEDIPEGDRFLRLVIGNLWPKTTRVQIPSITSVSSIIGGGSSIASGLVSKIVCGVLDVTTQQVVAYRAYATEVASWVPKVDYNVSADGTEFVLPSTGVEVHKYMMFAFSSFTLVDSQSFTVNNGSLQLVQYFDASQGIKNEDRELYDLPFVSNVVGPTGVQGDLRVSALPFRAVEAVYNSFYRDDRNNPLMIDGKPYYNVFVENKDGGADTRRYKLYKRNWEADVFTTAVQSPTQGILPLVGVTATGDMTFQDEAGKTYYLHAQLADDGTLEGITSYSSDMPNGTLRAMVDTISTGISINDFRNVNAFQRWLEVGMRKGLRYKDNIEAHFGASPTYSELDMPEFIGGMSRKVQMNRVVQSVDDTANDKPLGTLGGYATVLGEGGQRVSRYFDEHGWIIGFITITPKPVYSQQLAKQLIKTELLDHYFPEFAHITMQPITNKELAALQCNGAHTDNNSGLDDVFGYQRAWYEYLSSVDEVHGDFRTSMRDYLIQRIFNGVPQLGEEFLTVGDEEVNAVFAVNDPKVDKIFGQLYFDVKMKRPIPAIGIPKLEA